MISEIWHKIRYVLYFLFPPNFIKYAPLPCNTAQQQHCSSRNSNWFYGQFWQYKVKLLFFFVSAEFFLSAEFQNVEIPQQVMLILNMSSVQCPDSDVVTCWQLQWTVSGSVSVTMFMMSYDVWCLHSLTDPRSSFISPLYSGLFPCEIWWVHICISYQYFFVSQCLTFPIHL